jgi:hypothetical protein
VAATHTSRREERERKRARERTRERERDKKKKSGDERRGHLAGSTVGGPNLINGNSVTEC